MISNIGTVALYVDDQQKAKEFWTNKVGFDVILEQPMGPGAFWLEVAPKDSKTRLVLYPKAMMEGHEKMKASIVFEVDDIMGSYEEMKSNGVIFKGEPQKMSWGTFAHFSDEDGNEFIMKG